MLELPFELPGRFWRGNLHSHTGRVVEGPILDDNSYRRFVARIAEDLTFRSNGGAGHRDWDADNFYYP